MQKPRARTGQHGMEGLGALREQGWEARAWVRVSGAPGAAVPECRRLGGFTQQKCTLVVVPRASLKSRGREGCACSAVCRVSPSATLVSLAVVLPRVCAGSSLPSRSRWLALLVVLALQLHYSSLCPCHHTSSLWVSVLSFEGLQSYCEVPPHGLSLHQPKPDFQITPRSRVPGDRTPASLWGPQLHP